MKKKLLFCLALLGLVQFVSAEKPVDLTASKLSNFASPFTTTGQALITGKVRFQKLADWLTAGDLGTMGTDYTGWHHDAEKKSITLTAGWDGFLPSFDNMKVYQTVTLPAGKYSFSATRGQDWSGAGNAYLVVAEGAGIPDTTALTTALASKILSSDANLVTAAFTLTAETTISLGVVASFAEMPVDEGLCVAIGKFALVQWVAGTDMTALSNKVVAAKAMTAELYPVGIVMGTYPVEKWNALQAAISASEGLIANGDAEAQTTIDAQVITLQAAMTDLKNGIILPFKVSDDATSYWYQIRDKRATNSYWAVGEYIKDDVTVPQGLIMTQTDDNTSDAQLFKLVKSENGYYIFSKSTELPLARSVLGGTLQINADSIPVEIYVRSGSDMSHYIIFAKTAAGAEQQLNSYVNNNPAKIGFYNGGVADPGNNWEFVEKVEAGQTDFNALKALVAKAVTMKAVDYPATQFSAEKWNAFVATRTAATELVAKDGTTPQVEQTTVDAMIITLQTSIDELVATYVPFIASTDAQSNYYFIKDKRSPASYMYIGTTVVAEGDTLHNRLLYKKVIPTADSTAYMFKVVAVAGEEGVYQLYSKSNPEAPISVSVGVENLIHVSPIGVSEGEDTKWTFGTTPANDVVYRTITSQTSAMQINSFAGAASGFVGFYTATADDAGNDWSFVAAPVVNAVKNVTVSDLGISVRGRRIVCADSSAKLSVYGVLGQKMNANADLARGIYLVKVDGKLGTAKVVIR